MMQFPQFCLADEHFVRGKDRRNQTGHTSVPFPAPQIGMQEGEKRRAEETPEPCPFPLRGQGCGIARPGGIEFSEPFANREFAELASRGMSGGVGSHYDWTCN